MTCKRAFNARLYNKYVFIQTKGYRYEAKCMSITVKSWYEIFKIIN